MKRLKKKQRHKIYVRTESQFFDLHMAYYGVCDKILAVNFGPSKELKLNEFPELALFKENGNLYWLNVDEMDEEENKSFRYLVLLFCIEMTR